MPNMTRLVGVLGVIAGCLFVAGSVHAAQFSQGSQQAERRDASGRIITEAAAIVPFVCNGAGENGGSYYLYKYVKRSAYRVVHPPDWGHPIGGHDFGTQGQAVGIACGTLHLGHAVSGPVKIDIKFFANSMLTFAPKDGGRCPGAVAAQVGPGSIEAQITPQGHHEGGGGIADTPHLNKCRVPTIKIAVDHVVVEALTPGHVLRATLAVHIDGEGVHQPGQCRVGTRGTIVATYDDTLIVGNGLRNDQLRIGPWTTPCNAHNHLITNNISSIAAYASGSTYVVVGIGCLGQPGSGYGPRNCGM
jgi:hypothetical protein